MVIASLVLNIMLLSTMPVMAQQSNRLVFTLHAKGSSIMFWSGTLYVAEGVFNFAGTSLAEETEEYGFPVYILEEGSVHAAGDLFVKWTADDGSHHEIRVSLFGAEETFGPYFMFDQAIGTDPFGICGWFNPQNLTYQGQHIHDGIKEEISGEVSILAACQTKDPDYSGTIVDKWWIIWTFLEIDGNLVGVQFTELTIPHWYYGSGQVAYVPAAQVLKVQTRLI